MEENPSFYPVHLKHRNLQYFPEHVQETGSVIPTQGSTLTWGFNMSHALAKVSSRVWAAHQRSQGKQNHISSSWYCTPFIQREASHDSNTTLLFGQYSVCFCFISCFLGKQLNPCWWCHVDLKMHQISPLFLRPWGYQAGQRKQKVHQHEQNIRSRIMARQTV